MPDEVQQYTSDDLEKLDVFPLPVSGIITLKQTGADQYLIDCTNVSGADIKRMEDFYERMKGALHSFRYESSSHRLPHCRFGQGTVEFIQHAPDRCSVRFTLVILPPYPA